MFFSPSSSRCAQLGAVRQVVQQLVERNEARRQLAALQADHADNQRQLAALQEARAEDQRELASLREALEDATTPKVRPGPAAQRHAGWSHAWAGPMQVWKLLLSVARTA